MLLDPVPADVEINFAEVGRAWTAAIGPYQTLVKIPRHSPIAKTSSHDGGNGPRGWPDFPPLAEY